MKVGILTLELGANYGGVLQAYALYQTIKRMGHKPYIISFKKLREQNLKRRLLRFASIAVNTIFPLYLPHMKYREIASEKITKFIERNIPNRVFPKNLKDLRGMFDAYIVGSDQVWRPIYSRDVRHFFLDFASDFDGIKRISYAASFGVPDIKTEEFPTEIVSECSDLLKKFDAVSVREADAVKICQERFGREDAEWVLDPTMLLEKTDYLPKVEVETKGKFVNYILDLTPAKNEIIKCIEKAMGTETTSINDHIGVSHWRTTEIKRHRSIESWLTELASADFVFTDSFHGCVFCIIFNKPFAVQLNASRGNSRFKSLLSLYGLQDRVLESTDEIPSLLSRKIDWARVNERRAEMKEKSINFIRTKLDA